MIANSYPFFNLKGEIGGYHDDYVSGLAGELQEVEVYTISNKKCNRSRGKVDESRDNYHFEILNSMFCAEHPLRKDACQGDSGGPAVKKSGSGDNEIFELVGIVSWGNTW